MVRLGCRKTKLWNLDDISMEGQCIGGVKRVVSKHWDPIWVTFRLVLVLLKVSDYA